MRDPLYLPDSQNCKDGLLAKRTTWWLAGLKAKN